MSGFRHDDQELAKNIREIAKRCAGREQPAPGEPSRRHEEWCCLDLDHKGDCKRWMKLPPNNAYPNFKEIHVQDDWCPKAGCIPATKCDIDYHNQAGNAAQPEGGEKPVAYRQAPRPSGQISLAPELEPSSPPAPVGGAREFNERELRIQWTNPIHPDEIYQFAEAYADQKVRELRQERDDWKRDATYHKALSEKAVEAHKSEREARERAERERDALKAKLEGQ